MVDWKKDISFGRTPKTAEEAPAPESVEAKPEKTSLWKKEVSLGRRQKADPGESARSTPAPTPFWKKEVTFGRKTKPADREQPTTPGDTQEQDRSEQVLLSALEAIAQQRQPAAVELPAPEPEPEVVAAEPEPEPEPVLLPVPPETQPEPPPEPVLPPAAEAPPAPPEPVVDQPAADEREQLHPVSWVDAVLHASVAEEAAPAVPAEPATPAPAPPPPTLPPAAELPPPERPPAAEAAPPAPEPVVVPLPPPVPQAQVHPPVPAAELPPLPEEEKVPFWKKEIGGSKKKPKEPKPDSEKAPLWKLELGGSKKERKEAPVGEPELAGEKVPFWKLELGGSKKKKYKAGAAVATAAAAVAAEPELVEAKVPFWKKELGGSKKKKAAPAGGPAEPGAKKPLKKRGGFQLPRLELPNTRRGTQSHKELVGLKIGASQVAAARVSNNGVAEVTQVAREEIDPGIVVGGELRDPEALAQVLKQFFRDNKLPKRGIRLGIANNRIGVRTFEISGIEDAKQLSNAIRFRAQEALPIPIEEAVLDYHVIAESKNAEGETVRKILLVVAYRELVDRYVAACRDAGLSLAGIDLEAFALLRSLAAPREDEGPAPAALVAVAVGYDRSTFAVSDGRVCEFTRVLDWGGSTLSVRIARALDLTPSEIEPIKRLLSLDPGPAPAGVTEEVYVKAQQAVKQEINGFARELVSSLQFYQNQPGSLGIGEIILTGGTAHLPGFAAELQRLIGVRVKLGDPLVRVKVGKKVQEPEQLGSLAIAIGLGIED